MDRDAAWKLTRPIVNSDFTSSSTSSSSSHSDSDLFRSVQAALKRHRPLEMSIRPKRMLPVRGEVTKSSASSAACSDTNGSLGVATKGQDSTAKDPIVQQHDVAAVAKESLEYASVMMVSGSSIVTDTFADNLDVLIDQIKPNNDEQKKVQFATGSVASSKGADDNKASQLETLSSPMRSLALTGMEWVSISQPEASDVINHDSKHHPILIRQPELKLDGGISLLAKRTTAAQDQLHQFRNFLSQPMTQSSVVGPSCATTTSVHATSAPMPTTYYSSMNHSGHVEVEHLKDSDVNHPPSNAPLRGTAALLNPQIAVPTQPSTSALDTRNENNEFNLSKEQKGCEISLSKYQENPSVVDVKQTEAQEYAVDVANAQSQVTLPPNLCSNTKSEPSKSEKQEKVSGKAVPARKKNKYSDLFIKVNGKLYQRLGKIGSGGSSEVHKVISSDCTIYALKKIKLKGRDYATAFGFCQEIEYLNKLKGKSHIIQLVDYEVTDKALLHAVLSGSINNKDGRVKDDSYIYMVLEYGEIDLAHMLSQKWKEMDGSNQTIDENWLRFYWQVGTLSYMSPEAFMCNETDTDGNTIKCGRPSDIWSLGCILYQMVYGRTPFADYKTFWAKFKVITDPSHQILYDPVSNPCLLDLMKKCLAWDRNERWRIPELLQHPFLVPLVPTQPSSHEQSCRLLRIIDENCLGSSEAAKLLYELKQLLEDPAAATMSQLVTLREQQCTLLSQVSRICLQLQEQYQRDIGTDRTHRSL